MIDDRGIHSDTVTAWAKPEIGKALQLQGVTAQLDEGSKLSILFCLKEAD